VTASGQGPSAGVGVRRQGKGEFTSLILKECLYSGKWQGWCT
jgi:hypothetical protein